MSEMVAVACGSLSVPVEPRCVVGAPCKESQILLTTRLAKQREHMSAGAHTTRRTWPGPWKLNLKRPPTRQCAPAQAELRQPWELSHFPLRVWPGTCRLGWLAATSSLILAHPHMQVNPGGARAWVRAKLKFLIHVSEAVRLVPFLCGHFMECLQ